ATSCTKQMDSTNTNDEFKINGTGSNPYCMVTNNTKIVYDDQPIERKNAKSTLNQIGYIDVGGLKKPLKKIRGMVELPLEQPQSFITTGVKLSHDILLIGPPGTGKVLMVRAVANETGTFFVLINGSDIMSKSTNEAYSSLSNAFEENNLKKSKKSSAIIVIDQFDVIASKREETHGESERRVASKLLKLMDELK
ncbi:unnamed protein product, partial [Adineta steineri]